MRGRYGIPECVVLRNVTPSSLLVPAEGRTIMIQFYYRSREDDPSRPSMKQHRPNAFGHIVQQAVNGRMDILLCLEPTSRNSRVNCHAYQQRLI
jgi:hypothetical protein